MIEFGERWWKDGKKSGIMAESGKKLQKRVKYGRKTMGKIAD